MKGNTFLKASRAFTLVEFLLSIGLMAVLVTALAFFLSLSLKSRLKHQAVSEVESQGQFAMNFITRAIRNAMSIQSPPIGASSSTLSLSVSNPLLHPTVFSLSQGALMMQEGTNASVPLTSSRVFLSDLLFINTSQANTPGGIRVQFSLHHENPEGISEYDYTQSFYASTSLRP